MCTRRNAYTNDATGRCSAENVNDVISFAEGLAGVVLVIVVVEPLVLVGRVGTAEYTRYGNSRGADYSATQVEDLTRHVLVNSYCACIFYRYEGRRREKRKTRYRGIRNEIR